MQRKAVKAEHDKEVVKNEKRDSLPKQNSDDKDSREEKKIDGTSSGSRKAYERQSY